MNSFLQQVLVIAAAICAYIGNKKSKESDNYKGWFYVAGFLVAALIGTFLAENNLE